MQPSRTKIQRMTLPADGVCPAPDPTRSFENDGFKPTATGFGGGGDPRGTSAHDRKIDHSTVTLFAKLRGWSTTVTFATAT